MAEVNYFGISSSCISRRPAGRDFFENYAALFRTDWGKEPSMVCRTKRSQTSGSPTPVPADATLRNVFNHFAIQWLGRVLKHCYLVLWQGENAPPEPGVFFQYWGNIHYLFLFP